MTKKVKVGDLVRPTERALSNLREHSPQGFGCITKILEHRGGQADTVWVFWYEAGTVRPISRRWLEILS